MAERGTDGGVEIGGGGSAGKGDVGGEGIGVSDFDFKLDGRWVSGVDYGVGEGGGTSVTCSNSWSFSASRAAISASEGRRVGMDA